VTGDRDEIDASSGFQRLLSQLMRRARAL